MIDALITQPHLLPHSMTVWHALDETMRGRLFVGFDSRMNVEASKYGFDAHFGTPAPSDTPVLVASGNDLPGIQRAVLLEHGSGQTYRELDHICWAGGSGRENVILFVCPNDNVRWANQARYPNTPCAVVGSPHVELLRKLPPYPLSEPRIALSTHWEASHLVPELRSGWSWFENVYEKLCRERPDAFVLHGHPRHADYIAWKAREWGIEYEPNFEKLTQRAWLYCTDNSSTLFEWAALNRPVVVVSPPWYRETAGHGLRFNDYRDVGPHVRDPDELESAFVLGLADPGFAIQRRAEISCALFGTDLSTGAAARAARAIEEVIG